jgi:hypothetical protein
MEVKLRALDQLVSFSFSLPIREEERDDFIGFCSLQIMQGRNTRVNFWYWYVDFVRKTYGRHKEIYSGEIWNPVSCYLEEMAPVPDPSILENEIITRIDAQRAVEKIFKFVTTEELLIIKFLYFEELPASRLAKVLGVTESAISTRMKKLFKRLKKSEGIAKFHLDV